MNAAYTQADHTLREYDKYARAKYHLTLRWLRNRIRPEALLYNIGVGSGYFNHLAVHAGLRVVGCEPDPATFGKAQASLPLYGCELVQATLATFVVGRPPASLVVMHDVLEHIRDDEAAARDLHSIVEPGGRVILSVPALQVLFGRHDVELGHYRRYCKKTLRAVLEPMFRIHRLQYFGMASIPIVLYYSVLRREPYPAIGASESLVSQVYGAICALEARVPEPVGTALLAELEPR